MTEDSVLPAPAATLVIFGATGDLTRRLLLPALVNMTSQGLADQSLRILGVGIDEIDDASFLEALDTFRAAAGGNAKDRDDAWSSLKTRISYVQGDFTKDAVYAEINRRIELVPTANAVFYLAVPPQFFATIAGKLADNGLLQERENAFRRVAIEKPFGSDLNSARALNAAILSHMKETQIFRVDHFLGKETVQSIMTARFANQIIERLWNKDSIESVQITAAETVGVGTRGKFYDVTGALRDMVPNHLMTLLAMVAMEPPNSFDAEAIRDEKAKVLNAVHKWSEREAADNSVRGVYEAGSVLGVPVAGYTETPDVATTSSTETFVALKLLVDTWRWAGVPFYLRTGKAMTVRNTEVVVTFRKVPFAQFNDTSARRLPANRLVIQIQPNEGLSMEMLIKKPGLLIDTAPIKLDFKYADLFDIAHHVGYESLLYDLFTGDQTLFQRADAIEAGWAAVQPFLDVWQRDGKPLPYRAGTMGPPAAEDLLARASHTWHDVTPPQAPK
jgi:glucose-6-phosphate 1-dehydrogenase